MATTVTFTASASASIGQQQITVLATSGTYSANASLTISVVPAPVPDPFHVIGGQLRYGFYDETRQLLFATNESLNEVDVISGTTYAVKARVAIHQPVGIDQMADGQTLVIGTDAQEIVTLNEDSLAVTEYPFSYQGQGFYAVFFPLVTAMANGKVLVVAQEQGAQGEGEFVFEWKSSNNTWLQLEPTTQNLNWSTPGLARSADHKWAIFSADQFYLYESDTDTVTSINLNFAGQFGVRGFALNTDGSEIAVASANSLIYLNRSLQTVGTTPVPDGPFQSGSPVQFSADGSRSYLELDSPLAIEAYSTSNYQYLGYLSGYTNPIETAYNERLLTIDAEGRAYVGIQGGLRIVNVSQPVPNPVNNSVLTPPACTTLKALPLNTAAQVTSQSQMAGISMYLGTQPLTLSGSGSTAVTIPASTTAGALDAECIDSNGNTSVYPADVSYGVTPLALSANLLPTSGSALVDLYGFGLAANQQDVPASTLGGRSSQAVSVSTVGPGLLQDVTLEVGSGGSAGQSANLSLASSLGTGTLAAAATFYASTIIPTPDGVPMQITFDKVRNVLYVLESNKVDVLDATTNQWRTALPFPSGATAGAFTAMALSPDAAHLVLVGTGAQVIVLDASGLTAPQLLSGAAGTYSGTVAITKYNNAVIPGIFPTPWTILNLATLTLSAFTPASYTNIGALHSSPDGSYLYAAAFNISSGNIYSIDPLQYTTQSNSFLAEFWGDFGVSPDGSHFAGVTAASFETDPSQVAFFNSSLQYLNFSAYPDLSPYYYVGYVIGASYSPGGAVFAVPVEDSIYIWDASAGTLRARLVTPELLHSWIPSENASASRFTMNATGQTLYAVSNSGLTIITLPVPLDQTPAAVWPW